jgi:hypothetical protein
MPAIAAEDAAARRPLPPADRLLLDRLRRRFC